MFRKKAPAAVPFLLGFSFQSSSYEAGKALEKDGFTQERLLLEDGFEESVWLGSAGSLFSRAEMRFCKSPEAPVRVRLCGKDDGRIRRLAKERFGFDLEDMDRSLPHSTLPSYSKEFLHGVRVVLAVEGTGICLSVEKQEAEQKCRKQALEDAEWFRQWDKSAGEKKMRKMQEHF